MAKNYKVEWTEPSYGCCLMSKADASAFKNAMGTQKQIYVQRHNILQNYSNQKPFNGDGKLYYYTWDEFENTLPHIYKLNKAMAAEKVGRYNTIFALSQDLDYKKSLLAEIQGMSPQYKNQPTAMFENQASMCRRQDEGLVTANGNHMKGISLLVGPEISEIQKTIGDQVHSADLKTKAKAKSKTDKAANDASADIKDSFTQLSTSIKTLKQTTQKWNAKTAQIVASIQTQFTAAVAAGTALAEQARAQMEEVRAAMEEAVAMAIETAIAAIAGALSGLGGMIFTALPEANVVLTAIGAESTLANVVQKNCEKVEDSEPPIPPELLSMKSKCFIPKDREESFKTEAFQQATRFQIMVGGQAPIWDSKHYRYIVFYNINNHPVGGL